MSNKQSNIDSLGHVQEKSPEAVTKIAAASALGSLAIGLGGEIAESVGFMTDNFQGGFFIKAAGVLGCFAVGAKVRSWIRRTENNQ